MRDSPTHIDDARLQIARLIVIRTKELDLRQGAVGHLRGKRKAENIAQIARLTKGIAYLRRHGVARLRRWRTAAAKTEA
jgi:hypothetical protein